MSKENIISWIPSINRCTSSPGPIIATLPVRLFVLTFKRILCKCVSLSIALRQIRARYSTVNLRVRPRLSIQFSYLFIYLQRESRNLTSGGSSCSQMQLVTSPLQLLPPLLLSPRLPARLAVTTTATLLLLLLLLSPLHFPTLPMRQRPWAESPPPLSSPTSADSEAAVCTSTLWPSSSCTSRITTSVSAAAAAAAVLAHWLASNGRAPRLVSPLAKRLTSCVMTTLLLGVVALWWFVSLLRVYTSVLRTHCGVLC